MTYPLFLCSPLMKNGTYMGLTWEELGRSIPLFLIFFEKTAILP